MRDNDIIDLILQTTKKQLNTAVNRDDNLINIIELVEEEITLTDTSTTIEYKSHPVKWGEFTWNLATWG